MSNEPIPHDPLDSYPKMLRDNPNYTIRHDELMGYLKEQDVKFLTLLSRVMKLEAQMEVLTNNEDD
jgi:hypothetical protein